MNHIIEQRLADHLEVLQKLMASDLPQQLEKSAAYVEKALAGGHKVLFCGNGGSAADSQHLAIIIIIDTILFIIPPLFSNLFCLSLYMKYFSYNHIGLYPAFLLLTPVTS